VTKVIQRLQSFAFTLALGSMAIGAAGQENAPTQDRSHKPAEALYLQLRSVELDPQRVYHVRGVAIERASIHISLEDGTLAFTKDVEGKVTGAFFEGDGEILLSPPNMVERTSMALFTGAAILEERFSSGYFRFNDDTFDELKPSFRPAESPEEFISEWNQTAQNLAAIDALRLLMTFSKTLPIPDEDSRASEPLHQERMWHARLQGNTYGPFDVYYDSDAVEQVWAGQAKLAEGGYFYDMWTSFSLATSNRPGDAMDSSAKVDAISIPSYKIKSEIRLPATLNAEAWLKMDVRKGGQRTALFELSRFLELKRVESNGKPIEFIHNQAIEGTDLAKRGNDLVAVVFPRILRAGEQVELHFVYGGDVLSEAGGGLLYVGARGTWFPNRRLAMSSYDMEFHYPAGWTLVATGKRVKEGVPPDAASGEQVSRWVSERPLPFAGFNLGKYKSVAARAGETVVEAYASSGVEEIFPESTTEISSPPVNLPPGLRQHDQTVRIPAPPPSPARNAQAVADVSAQAITFFSRLYGPFPYGSLSLTQQPGAVNQGWPSLIFLSSFSFLSEADRQRLRVTPGSLRQGSGIIAHETAHQWWGDLVTWATYRDQWISEALADYSALMFLESTDPRKFRSTLDDYRKDLLEKNRDGKLQMEAGPVTLGIRLFSSKFPDGYTTSSYERGAWLLHMLRTMMRDGESLSGIRRRGSRPANDISDEPFVRALRNARQKFEGKPISTAELLKVFEAELTPALWHEGNKSLDWFFEGWIQGTSIPDLSLENVKYAPKGGGVLVTGKILQKDAPKGLVTSVPIYASLKGRNVLLGRVFTEDEETPFSLSAPLGTKKLALDPEATVLSRER
jgi:hypothetical protein